MVPQTVQLFTAEFGEKTLTHQLLFLHLRCEKQRVFEPAVTAADSQRLQRAPREANEGRIRQDGKEIHGLDELRPHPHPFRRLRIGPPHQ